MKMVKRMIAIALMLSFVFSFAGCKRAQIQNKKEQTPAAKSSSTTTAKTADVEKDKTADEKTEAETEDNKTDDKKAEEPASTQNSGSSGSGSSQTPPATTQASVPQATKIPETTKAQTTTTTVAPKTTVYTEADAIRFRNEIEAYAVSKGYIVDRSLNANNSAWVSEEMGFDENVPGDYETGMMYAKQLIDTASQGPYHERINIIYYHSSDGWWWFVAYRM